MEIHARRILLLGVLTAFAFGFPIAAPICAQTPEKPPKKPRLAEFDHRRPEF
ncbi:MAG: hypothetical protein JSS81_19270 [Acidobacteria bacterium]|nr:hypothetical protein [Acidobacteriota bacterium]